MAWQDAQLLEVLRDLDHILKRGAWVDPKYRTLGALSTDLPSAAFPLESFALDRLEPSTDPQYLAIKLPVYASREALLDGSYRWGLLGATRDARAYSETEHLVGRIYLFLTREAVRAAGAHLSEHGLMMAHHTSPIVYLWAPFYRTKPPLSSDQRSNRHVYNMLLTAKLISSKYAWENPSQEAGEAALKLFNAPSTATLKVSGTSLQDLSWFKTTTGMQTTTAASLTRRRSIYENQVTEEMLIEFNGTFLTRASDPRYRDRMRQLSKTLVRDRSIDVLDFLQRVADAVRDDLRVPYTKWRYGRMGLFPNTRGMGRNPQLYVFPTAFIGEIQLPKDELASQYRIYVTERGVHFGNRTAIVLLDAFLQSKAVLAFTQTLRTRTPSIEPPRMTLTKRGHLSHTTTIFSANSVKMPQLRSALMLAYGTAIKEFHTTIGVEIQALLASSSMFKATALAQKASVTTSIFTSYEGLIGKTLCTAHALAATTRTQSMPLFDTRTSEATDAYAHFTDVVSTVLVSKSEEAQTPAQKKQAKTCRSGIHDVFKAVHGTWEFAWIYTQLHRVYSAIDRASNTLPLSETIMTRLVELNLRQHKSFRFAPFYAVTREEQLSYYDEASAEDSLAPKVVNSIKQQLVALKLNGAAGGFRSSTDAHAVSENCNRSVHLYLRALEATHVFASVIALSLREYAIDLVITLREALNITSVASVGADGDAYDILLVYTQLLDVMRDEQTTSPLLKSLAEFGRNILHAADAAAVSFYTAAGINATIGMTEDSTSFGQRHYVADVLAMLSSGSEDITLRVHYSLRTRTA